MLGSVPRWPCGYVQRPYLLLRSLASPSPSLTAPARFRYARPGTTLAPRPIADPFSFLFLFFFQLAASCFSLFSFVAVPLRGRLTTLRSISEQQNDREFRCGTIVPRVIVTLNINTICIFLAQRPDLTKFEQISYFLPLLFVCELHGYVTRSNQEINSSHTREKYTNKSLSVISNVNGRVKRVNI